MDTEAEKIWAVPQEQEEKALMLQEYHATKEWENRMVREGLADLELMVVDLIPEDSLPLFVNRLWICKEAHHRYRHRLKNAGFSGK